MLDEKEFRRRSDEALDALQRALERAADRYGFEVDRNQGALGVEFEDPPAKFVVSPNSPVRQIWVSARVKSFKLDWNEATAQFEFTGGQSLLELIARLAGEQLGEPVDLS
jgi:iron donor protein CyaY